MSCGEIVFTTVLHIIKVYSRISIKHKYKLDKTLGQEVFIRIISEENYRTVVNENLISISGKNFFNESLLFI